MSIPEQKCPHCSKPILHGAQWCPYCGASLIDERHPYGKVSSHRFSTWIIAMFILILPLVAFGGCWLNFSLDSPTTASNVWFLVASLGCPASILVGIVLYVLNVAYMRKQ